VATGKRTLIGTDAALFRRYCLESKHPRSSSVFTFVNSPQTPKGKYLRVDILFRLHTTTTYENEQYVVLIYLHSLSYSHCRDDAMLYLLCKNPIHEKCNCTAIAMLCKTP
jgi:hypothetical protein